MDKLDTSERQPRSEPERVRCHLRAVLESPGFSRAPSISSFLTYIVEKALASEEPAISAYAIATEALGRSEDFDSLTDPVVRVSAGRLRQALERYYTSEDADDDVRILLPSGGYVPQFEFASPAPENAAGTIDIPPEAPEASEPPLPTAVAAAPPAVAEHPLRQLAIPLAAAFGGAAIFGLALLFASWAYSPKAPPPVSVERPAPAAVQTASASPAAAPLPVAPYLASSNTRSRRDFFPRVALYATRVETPLDWYRSDAAEAAARSIISRFDEISLISEGIKTEADYDLVIEAFGVSESMRIFVRLEQRERGVVIWSSDFDLKKGEADQAPSLTNFFGMALAPVLSPYGVLLSDLTRMENPPPRIRCIATAYQYFDHETLSSRLAAHECLDAMITNGVVHPTIFALKSSMHLEGYLTARPVVFDGQDPLREARRAARRALRAAPTSARAHQATFDVRKIERRHEQALSAADHARAANPFDIDVIADVAAYAASRGLHAEAEPLFRQALDSSLQLPAWIIANYAFHLLLTGDRIGAYEVSLSRSASSSPLIAAAMAIAAHDYGDEVSRNEAVDTLIAKEPSFALDPTAAMMRRGFAADISRVIGGKLTAIFNAAGVPNGARKI